MSLIVVHQPSPRWDLYAAPAVLLAGGAITLISRRAYRTKATLLVAFVFISCVLANRTSADPQMQTIYVLASVLAGVLMGPPLATLVAGLGTAAVILQTGYAIGDRSVLLNLALLWLSAVVMWASVGRLYLVVQQADSGEARAWQAVKEARARRGKLCGVV